MSLTDSTGKAVNEYKYDIWGNISEKKETIENPIRYSGEYYDEESGLYYLRARYYDPVTARFISRDSYEGKQTNPLSQNLYSYCFNNPLIYSDPSGHDPFRQKHMNDAKKKASEYMPEYYAFWGAFSRRIYDFAMYTKNMTNPVSNLITNAQLAKALIKDPSLFYEMIPNPKRWIDNWNNGDSISRSKQLGALFADASIALAMRGSKTPKNACFTADTLVKTAEGDRPIKEIKVGDLVWSENPETGEKGLKKVKQVFVHEKSELLTVYTNGEKIETTEEHPFWAEDKGWMDAGKLNPGDVLRLQSGERVTVKKLELRKLKKPVKVYNFEVEDWHTYYVSGSGVLVHNTCDLAKNLKNFYTSIKKAPNYPNGFKMVQNGTQKVIINNASLLGELRKVESGKWYKIYKDGYNSSGKKISIHYFESPSGKVFNVKVKSGWSKD